MELRVENITQNKNLPQYSVIYSSRFKLQNIFSYRSIYFRKIFNSISKERGWNFLVYENIKEICKKKGIAITEVESKANLARGSIFKWTESSPTAKNLKAVADVLNVKVDTLLKEQEDAYACND